MRLTDFERAAIRQAVAKRFGADARVRLFGSRVDDAKKGGDIDLLVELPSTPVRPLKTELELEVDLICAMGDRKIDILLDYPGAEDNAMRQIARQTGIAV